MKIYKNTFLILTIFCPSIISSCTEGNRNIKHAVESAWNDIEDAIDDKAEEYCKSFANNPQSLYKGCNADFIPLIDNFNLTIPLDRTTHLAAGLIFGDDAGDFVSSIDNFNRNNKSKQDVKKDLIKHFNGSLATLMTSLIILDGELSYELETDDLLNPSFDFDKNDLYEILNDKEYFNAAYGDEVPRN